jgi:nucleotide-binding universal stress UspA family protein
MFRNIIVALDGSAVSEQALPVAAGIARRASASLTAVHALDFVNIEYERCPDPPDAWSECTYDRALRYLELLREEVWQKWHIQMKTALVEAEADTVLIHLPPANGADLLVLTTHARGPFDRFWLGSTADCVVREANCPVLLLNPTAIGKGMHGDEPFTNVLVPIDESQNSERALSVAAELARTNGARLTLLHVEAPILMPALLSEVAYGAAHGDGYLERLAKPWREVCRAVDCDSIHSVGPAAPHIVDYAARHDVDLIVIPTHGHGRLRRIMIGSVADKLIRTSHVPVLVVKPPPYEGRA